MPPFLVLPLAFVSIRCWTYRHIDGCACCCLSLHSSFSKSTHVARTLFESLGSCCWFWKILPTQNAICINMCWSLAPSRKHGHYFVPVIRKTGICILMLLCYLFQHIFVHTACFKHSSLHNFERSSSQRSCWREYGLRMPESSGHSGRLAVEAFLLL